MNWQARLLLLPQLGQSLSLLNGAAVSSRGWTCRRVRCGHLNTPAKRKCEACGGPRPKKRVPAHRQALRDVSYEEYLELNQEIHGVGEECALCGRPPRTRRLDRDHDHVHGRPR